MINLPKLSIWFVRRPVTTALLVFMALLGMTFYITQEYYQLQLRNATREAENIMLSAEKSIQQTIDVSHLVALKASISINDKGELEDFDSVAMSLLKRYPIINTIQMVPGGVITYCYPMEGNESVIGYDILADSMVNKEAYRAIELKEMYFAGPLELKQGGLAVVGRIPVYRGGEFWGFSAVIIMLNDLLTNASALADDYNKYRLDFSKVNPNTNEEEFFLGAERFENETVFQSTFLLAGEWTIYLYTDNTKNALAMSIPVAITGIFCSFLFAVVFGSILYKSGQQYRSVVQLAEKRIYTFLNRISDGFISLDAKWNYIYANENAGKSSGMKSKDLVGNNIWNLFPQLVDQPIYVAYTKAMATQEFMYFEDYYEPFDTHFEHFIYPSKDGLSVFFRDITEKKRQEKLYFLAEQKLSNHLNQSPMAVIEWDADFRVIQWSQKAQEIFGWREEEALGLNVEEMNLTYPEDNNLVDEIKNELKERRRGNQSLNKNRTKSGKNIYCQWYNSVINDDAGNIISVMSLVQDVTASQKDKEQLIESTRLLEATQSMADIGSWKLDLSANELFWSKEMYKIYDVDKDFNPTPQNVAKFHGDNYQDELKKIFESHSSNTHTNESQLITNSGKVKWVRAHIEKLPHSDNIIYLGSLQDITEIKRAEEEKSKEQERKLQKQKVLFELSKIDDSLSFKVKIERSLKLSASILKCERLSFWTLNDDKSTLKAVSLYENSKDEFSLPSDLNQADFPTYFKNIITLKNDGLIVANDAHTHEVTKEFSEIYLAPNHITAMLDIPVHRAGECIGVLCCEHVNTSKTWTVEDITFAKSIADIIFLMIESENRKRAEESIRLSEARHKALIKSSNTGAWEYFIGQSKFWCSEEYFTMLGYSPQHFDFDGEVLNVWLTLIHPEDRQKAEEKFIKYVENPEGFYEKVFRMLHADGNYRWVWSRGFYIADVNNEGKGRIVGAHIDVTDRKKFENELQTINASLRKLSAHLQTVREEERTHIAREIHDELGNQLTGLKLDLSRLKAELEELESNEDLMQKADDMIEKVVSTITAVRKISSDLRPSTLDDLGLIATIQWQAQQFEQRSGIKCDLQLKKLKTELSKDVNTTVFRIFQESLTNVMRHAKATQVSVKMYESHDMLIMKVTDNGIGISDKRKYNTSSLGLLGMTERAAVLNGTFNIENDNGNGTTATLKIPVNTSFVEETKNQ